MNCWCGHGPGQRRVRREGGRIVIIFIFSISSLLLSYTLPPFVILTFLGPPLRLLVVGGGAAGVELALAMQHRLGREMEGGTKRVEVGTKGGREGGREGRKGSGAPYAGNAALSGERNGGWKKERYMCLTFLPPSLLSSLPRSPSSPKVPPFSTATPQKSKIFSSASSKRGASLCTRWQKPQGWREYKVREGGREGS